MGEMGERGLKKSNRFPMEKPLAIPSLKFDKLKIRLDPPLAYVFKSSPEIFLAWRKKNQNKLLASMFVFRRLKIFTVISSSSENFHFS